MNAVSSPYSTSPAAALSSLLRHRQLIWQLTKRDVVGRYRGSVLGLFWSLVNPLLMLAVYTFVFGYVFRAKWGIAEPESKLDFAIILFVGLIVYNIFAECMNRSPAAILAQPNFVKKIVFPLEVQAYVILGSALFHGLISLVVLLVFFLFVHGIPPWTIILFPFILLPLIFFCLGLSWFLLSFGVFVRDVGQVVGVITTALLFLSPLFFPSSALPEKVRPLIQLNPLSFPIEQARETIIWGHTPNWMGLALYGMTCFVIMWLGFAWFQKTRKGFADVI
jgi:lipopolysaccharide transport system permease protein